MAKENLEKKSNSGVGRKIRKAFMGTALVTTLFTGAGCDNGAGKGNDKTTTNIEQIDKENKDGIVKNSDGTYSIYREGKKMSGDYSEIYPQYKYNGYYKGLREDEHKDILNERGEVLVGNGEYDDISLGFVTHEGVLGIIATKEGKDYLITMDGHNEDFGPIDEIFDVKLVEGTEDGVAIIGKNNGKTILYYNGKQIGELPAKYNSDCMALTLESLKLLNDKLLYTIYNENENPTIVYGNKKIKAKYPNVDNIQEYNGNIIYVGYTYDANGNLTDVAIVSGDKVIKVEENFDLIINPKTSLAFYLQYGYLK